MWKLTDYLWFSLFVVIAFFKGLWQGIRQISGYISARISKNLHMVNEIVKNRKTGNTFRDRRIQALRNNRRNDPTDS